MISAASAVETRFVFAITPERSGTVTGRYFPPFPAGSVLVIGSGKPLPTVAVKAQKVNE